MTYVGSWDKVAVDYSIYTLAFPLEPINLRNYPDALSGISSRKVHRGAYLAPLPTSPSSQTPKAQHALRTVISKRSYT